MGGKRLAHLFFIAVLLNALEFRTRHQSYSIIFVRDPMSLPTATTANVGHGIGGKNRIRMERKGEEKDIRSEVYATRRQHIPVMRVPCIGERDDTLLHQCPKLLDCRDGANAASHACSNNSRDDRRRELVRRRGHGAGVQTPGTPLACGGCRYHNSYRYYGRNRLQLRRPHIVTVHAVAIVDAVDCGWRKAGG
jgi:hypothetical protein